MPPAEGRRKTPHFGVGFSFSMVPRCGYIVEAPGGARRRQSEQVVGGRRATPLGAGPDQTMQRDLGVLRVS